MKHKRLLLAVPALILSIITLFVLVSQGTTAEVLTPKGPVAEAQKNLIIFAALLSLVVVVPVFALTGWIAWRYRASNKKARYTPDWDHSKIAETIWWGIPLILILVLAVVTWISTHQLDPTRPLASTNKVLNVQVVALEWKWLFIYPEQGIASVNHLQIPVDTPVKFSITADAPMNSFWIPQLGGQIYAMSGMSTHLNLMAKKPGDYRGMSANLSGEGFSRMNFTTRASSNEMFTRWVEQHKGNTAKLDSNTYPELAKKNIPTEPSYYGSVEAGLYDTVVMKHMAHGNTHQPTSDDHEEGH
jgi:cytochrome o ubiquinol oxidase subunit II